MQYIKQKIYNPIENVKKLIEENKIDPYEGYIYISLLVSQNSHDPSTKTGACITSDNFEVLSYGFNGVPKKFEDSVNWNNNNYGDDWLNSKYPYVFHAERQAIFSAFKQKKDLKNGILFVTLFPCNECALSIIESGINKLYYYDDKYHDREFSLAARKLLDVCRVNYEQIEIKDKYLIKKINSLGEL